MIAVGFASPAGLAWLGRRTRGRRVSLLIGDTRYKYWRNASRADREGCLAFLRRAEVEVRNWYRTSKSRSGESAAHLKVWAVHDRGSVSAALVGSGNLTRRGLDGNVEVMVEAHGADRHETWATTQRLWAEAWPCEDRLVGYLTQDEGARRRASGDSWHAQPQAERVNQISGTTRRPAPGGAPVSQAAGMWQRIGARLIDACAGVALVAVIGGFTTSGGAMSALFWAVAAYLVYEVVAVAVFGGTLGMRLTGIKVVSAVDLIKPGFGRSVGRLAVLTALLLVPLLGPALCFVSLLAGLRNPQRQGWHDKASNTRVVVA